MPDVTFDMEHNKMQVYQRNAEHWKVTLVDTSEEKLTGGRLKRVGDYIRGEDSFYFTYGDGVSDVYFSAVIAFHKSYGKQTTVTAVQPPGRYGALVNELQRRKTASKTRQLQRSIREICYPCMQ